MRKRLNKRASKMKFARTKMKTKKSNRTGNAYRGGYRL